MEFWWREWINIRWHRFYLFDNIVIRVSLRGSRLILISILFFLLSLLKQYLSFNNLLEFGHLSFTNKSFGLLSFLVFPFGCKLKSLSL